MQNQLEQQIASLIQRVKSQGRKVCLVGKREPGILLDIEKDGGELVDKIAEIGFEKFMKILGVGFYIAIPSTDQLTEMYLKKEVHRSYSESVSLAFRIREGNLSDLLHYSL